MRSVLLTLLTIVAAPVFADAAHADDRRADAGVDRSERAWSAECAERITAARDAIAVELPTLAATQVQSWPTAVQLQRARGGEGIFVVSVRDDARTPESDWRHVKTRGVFITRTARGRTATIAAFDVPLATAARFLAHMRYPVDDCLRR